MRSSDHKHQPMLNDASKNSRYAFKNWKQKFAGWNVFLPARNVIIISIAAIVYTAWLLSLLFNLTTQR